MKTRIWLLSVFTLFATSWAWGQDTKKLLDENLGSVIVIKNVDVLGYGFFVDNDLAVTNYQVMNRARTGAARASFAGKDASCEVTGFVSDDKPGNLVLLRLDCDSGTPLQLRETPVAPGEELYLFDDRADSGIVLIRGNCIETKDYGGFNLIKISAAAAISDNGFPVLDKNGRVAGVSVSSPGRDTSTSYAIPAEKVKYLIAEKRDYVKKLSELIPQEIVVKEKTPEKNQVVVQFLEQGNARLAIKDYRGAVERFSAAIKIAPADADAYVFRGQARYMLMEYKNAYDDFDKAIDLQPDYAEAYDLRGIVKSELGDKEGACEDWYKSYQLGFNHAFQLLKEFCNLEKYK